MNKRCARRKPDSPGGGQLTGCDLSPAARRLLSGLAAGACAMADPTDGAFLILRAGTGGVTLGRGRFARAAGEELVARDLAAWSGPSRLLAVTSAGLAHERRRTAPGDDPFAAQHRTTAEVTLAGEQGPERVRVDLDESPLARLGRLKDRSGQPFLDPASVEAGERLRRDLTQGGLMPGITARWDGSVGGGRRDPAGATDAMLAARQRVEHAVAAVGAEDGDLLIDLCGFLKGLELIERERDWPARSAKIMARRALNRLAEHYGLRREARGPARSAGIQAWRA